MKLKNHIKDLSNKSSGLGGAGGAGSPQPKRGLSSKKTSIVNNPKSAHKNLSYEECKKLSDEFLLPCKVIYELHSEFNSLLDI